VVLVTNITEEVEGVLEGGDGILESPRLAQGVAEVAECQAFAVPVAGLPVDATAPW
jgi:hypothetical protein